MRKPRRTRERAWREVGRNGDHRRTAEHCAESRSTSRSSPVRDKGPALNYELPNGKEQQGKGVSGRMRSRRRRSTLWPPQKADGDDQAASQQRMTLALIDYRKRSNTKH
ncbi:unnamed protein product [Heligmosomoides polygyrus]|uniref:Uncharacterized protein n=1 Tax=Heligmosomoides polygyrus TaxID=6339 RepID=A0A183FZG8_HELPZ|nr:unnamed protein product [Heligmosomoides polygyrus]